MGSILCWGDFLLTLYVLSGYALGVPETPATHSSESVCQHCGQSVQYGRPSDLAYRAFFHVATGTAACPANGTEGS
jgi:hypothetical protein